MRLIILMAALGLTGCAMPVTERGICIGLGPHVAELRSGLEAHPETPEAVGEAGTTVVLGFEGACN
jgi:hypothetical protein